MHWRLNCTHARRVAPGVRDQQVGASASHPETMMAFTIPSQRHLHVVGSSCLGGFLWNISFTSSSGWGKGCCCSWMLFATGGWMNEWREDLDDSSDAGTTKYPWHSFTPQFIKNRSHLFYIADQRWVCVYVCVCARERKNTKGGGKGEERSLREPSRAQFSHTCRQPPPLEVHCSYAEALSAHLRHFSPSCSLARSRFHRRAGLVLNASFISISL